MFNRGRMVWRSPNYAENTICLVFPVISTSKYFLPKNTRHFGLHPPAWHVSKTLYPIFDHLPQCGSSTLKDFVFIFKWSGRARWHKGDRSQICDIWRITFVLLWRILNNLRRIIIQKCICWRLSLPVWLSVMSRTYVYGARLIVRFTRPNWNP